MQLLVLASSRSGEVDDGLDAALERLRSGADVEVRTTDGPEDLTAALDARGERLLVVAGGDGALHLTVDALRRRGELGRATVGLLPLGTGNDFARSLGGPLEPGPAADALLSGRVQRLDLVVGTRADPAADAGREFVVVNAAHLGVGARAGAAASRVKPWLGPLAYPLGAAAAGAATRGWRLTVEVDGEPLVSERPVLMVGFGNGRTAGGGTPLQPQADLDDGCLDVMVAAATGPLARVGFAVALRRGRHAGRTDVRSARGRRVTVAGDPVPGNVDGEVAPPSSRWTFHVEPEAWAVRVPARSANA